MKSVSRLILINLFCATAFPVAADDLSNQYNQQNSANSQTLVQYLQNLGGFMGYDLTQSPTANNQTISQQLLNISTTQLTESYVFNTFFGALPVNAISTAFSQFVPTGAPGANYINALANLTYKQYSSPSSPSGAASGSQAGVSVNPLIDQETFQQDPVSQAVLNILGTPDYSYCMNYDQSAAIPSCKLLYQNLVMSNVLGTIPTPTQFYTYQYNQEIIGQLNSNSLMGPLQYSNESAQQGTGSPTPSSQNPGLVAQTQVDEAANFVRYASGSVAPGTLPQQNAYTILYNQAVPPEGSTNVSPTQQLQAQNTLTNYFANLRIFAAQSSVGVGNLYYILSKRLPQNQGGTKSILTSQAQSEFNMATWRLYNPDQSPNKQWITQLNGASSATVQKEIATLLAEINYQMYLDRQLQERLLLTNSIMLIQNTRSGQPSADFNQGNTSSSTAQ